MGGNTNYHKPDAANIKVCWNFNRETCIEVWRFSNFVGYIPLDVSRSLHVMQSSEPLFDSKYKPIPDYPPDRACKLYLSYGKKIGVTQEALKYLLLMSNMTESEIKEMTDKSKLLEIGKEEVTSKPAKSSKVIKKVTGAPKVMETKPIGQPKPVKKPAASTDKKLTASQLFKDLILAGKLTDDEIFAEVKNKFGLDDNKRGYVKWYRNDLTKKGFKVPKAK